VPPIAAERARRAADGGPWTSLLTAPAAAGLAAVGFDPVGEVMGSIVQSIRWTAYSGCTAYGNLGRRPRAPIVRFDGFAPYSNALTRGYATALKRMLLEASAIGADGVVGVRLTATKLLGGATEITALGTGVHARSHTRPRYVFSTHLPGQDVAKLLSAGWVPVDLVFGVSVAILHDLGQSSWVVGNDEYDGYTKLINGARADARERFARRIGTKGADGAIVSSMALRSWSMEASGGHRHRVAEASMFGTSVARFRRSTSTPARTLTFLPLK
jgi:uncharacterized protein YbjQ (UPF0145 family)